MHNCVLPARRATGQQRFLGWLGWILFLWSLIQHGIAVQLFFYPPAAFSSLCAAICFNFSKWPRADSGVAPNQLLASDASLRLAVSPSFMQADPHRPLTQALMGHKTGLNDRRSWDFLISTMQNINKYMTFSWASFSVCKVSYIYFLFKSPTFIYTQRLSVRLNTMGRVSTSRSHADLQAVQVIENG